MKYPSEKIIGYILLVLGIILIIYPGFSVYAVFTGSAEPFELFKFAGISINPAQFISDIPQGANLQSAELVSSELINNPINIIAHVIFMGFLASIGFRLASLGTMLVRPIVVKVREASSNA